MDSFLPALIAALLASATDRPVWLAAILGDRFERRGRVAVAAVLAQAVVMGVGAAGALWVRDLLTPNARDLVLALSLLAAAFGCAIPPKPPADRLEGWRTGAFVTTLAGVFILGFGDRTQFVAFGMACWGSSPVLAGVGAAIGASVPCIAAAMLGERAWRRLPLRAMGWVSAILLGGSGLNLLLGALRVI